MDRREFIRNFAVASALAAGGILGGSTEASEQREWGLVDILRYGNRLNAEAVPRIVLEQTKREEVHISEEEIGIHFQKFIRYLASRNIFLGDIVAEPLEASSTIWIKPVAKEHVEYAGNYQSLAEDTIEHMIGFIGSHYVRSPNLRFVIVRSIGDVRLDAGGNIPIYLVGDLGFRNSIRYRISANGESKEYEYPEFVSIKGVTNRSVDFIPVHSDGLLKGYTAESSPGQLFISVSEGFFSLIEAPAAEVLHHILTEYTIKNMLEEISNSATENKRELEGRHLYDVKKRHKLMEEILVHGTLANFWIWRYLRQHNIGFKEESAKKYIESYEAPYYKGTTAFANVLRAIGVPKAFELYAIGRLGELFGSIIPQNK